MNESILLEALKKIRLGKYDFTKTSAAEISAEAIKKWEDSPAGKTNFYEKYKDLTLKKREDSSGKETGMKKVTHEDLKLCFKEYDGTISHEDFYKGLRAIDHYLPTIYNTFFAGTEFARQSVPPYKEEETELPDFTQERKIFNSSKEEVDKEFKWTDDLVKKYAEIYRFSSSRTSIEQFKKNPDWVSQKAANENYDAAILESKEEAGMKNNEDE